MNLFLRKIGLTQVLVFLLLSVSFFIRLQFYAHNYPDFTTQDQSVEYLVASHIVQYHEFPLVGTTALQGYLPINSPFYYYFYAFFLLFHRSVVTLYVLNIVLQTLTALAIYGITKELFGKNAGIIALIFACFSYWGMNAARYFFQPYVMQPFFFGSLYLLTIAYSRKRYAYCIGSIWCFVIATSLHLSPLAYVLPYAIALWIVSRRISSGIAIRSFAWLGAGFFVSFITVFYALVHEHLNVLSPEFQPFIASFGVLPARVREFIYVFEYTVFPYGNGLVFGMRLTTWIELMLLVASLAFVIGVKSHRKKNVFMTIMVLVLLPILFSAFLNVRTNVHYVELSGGFFIIALASVIDSLLTKNVLVSTIGILICLVVLFVSSNGFQYRVPLRSTQANQAFSAVLTEMKNMNISQVSFVLASVGTQRGSISYTVTNDYYFWQMLEENQKKKFVSTNIYNGLPIVPQQTPVVFLTCTGAEIMQRVEAQNHCRQRFESENPEYVWTGTVFSSNSINTHKFIKKH